MTFLGLRRCGLVAAAVVWVFASSARAQFLFDATKAETAGSADWVIDADAHNLGPNGSGVMVVGAGGNDSNPQQTPTPAASGIVSSTPESYWQGALSAWGVSLVKGGKTVSTLPFNGAITYGNGFNPQDLSHYKVFVVDEPNASFTAAETTAIYNFIKAGNSLIAISDHAISDRNGDGVDSVGVWNGFLAADGSTLNPLGIAVNANDISPDTFNIDTSASDPITLGPYGTVDEFVYHNGASMTLSTSANPSVRGAVWASTPSSSNVLVAFGTYGSGKYVFIGDSSPFDDGTGDLNDTLHNGWDEAGGYHARLAMNASIWAAVPEPASVSAAVLAVAAVFMSRNRRD
jgi:hypothetical protein